MSLTKENKTNITIPKGKVGNLRDLKGIIRATTSLQNPTTSYNFLNP